MAVETEAAATEAAEKVAGRVAVTGAAEKVAAD